MAETVGSIVVKVGPDFDLRAYLFGSDRPAGAPNDDPDLGHAETTEGQDHG